MKKMLFTFAICITFQSCDYGQYKAEEEINKLHSQLDSVRSAIYHSQEYFEGQIEELYEYTSENDTMINNKIELLWEDFHYKMEDLVETTGYPEYDFECY